eukprot:TRINITY_DN2388_c0_g1_i1.p3 TRINITY_DN2388_c0_g1~~TRINITY_DN2388_c0_g1_i1.p3  ORF type:complete len:119 (-),score=0.62 TRINITY_DN2388_c0_g1_i1:751-1107(-)
MRFVFLCFVVVFFLRCKKEPPHPTTTKGSSAAVKPFLLHPPAMRHGGENRDLASLICSVDSTAVPKRFASSTPNQRATPHTHLPAKPRDAPSAGLHRRPSRFVLKGSARREGVRHAAV